MLREVIPVSKKRAVDPRFDRAFGHFNEDLFSKSYGFLGEMQREERQKLQTSLKGEADPSRRETIKRTLERMVLDGTLE